MTIKKIVVLGLGKVGSLVATLLHNTGFEVLGVDQGMKQKYRFKTQSVDVTKKDTLTKLLKDADAVVSCLPYFLNKNIAAAAVATNTHYFDLTEDVSTTAYIRDLSKKSKTLLAPQCGLAPGFIGIVGAHLAGQFLALRSIDLMVGALPAHPKGHLGYACTWSPDGVINEYVNDCEVVHNGIRKTVPALEGLENVAINGMALEAFTTSGGLGTLCETYEGRVDSLTYKTMRYPGHCQGMRLLLNELLLKDHKELAVELLKNACPPVPEDVVYVYASVTGAMDKSNTLETAQFVAAYRPLEIDGEVWRAISWTTAASIAAVVEMVAKKKLPQKGFLKQEDIDLTDFLATDNGALYATATAE